MKISLVKNRLKNKFIKIKKKIIFDIVKRKKIKHYKK
jgi:hypothetical protein